MSVNWKKVYAENSHLQNEVHWKICFEDIPSKYRKVTRRNFDICYEMRHGGVGCLVAEKYGVHPSHVTYLMKRAFSTDDEGEFLLARGLISHGYASKPIRKKPLPTKKTKGGAKSALNAAFEMHPDWRDELFELVVADLERKPYAINLTPKIFAGIARTGLRARNWPADMWPFCNASQGYQTFRNLLFEFKNIIAMEKANLRKSLEGFKKSDPAKMPFDEVQIDWQTCDAFCRLTTECEGNVVDTRLDRCSLFVAYCVKSRCVLAWHLALTRNPSHHDVLQVIDKIYTQRLIEIKYTPELSHPADAGYPSSVIPDIHMIGINTISMDNAWANMARHISDRVCKNGTALRFGKGGSPLDRNFVESVFNYVNGLTHRFASTTGSSPSDPIREDPKNAKNVPLLSLQSFRELIDVWISHYNSDVKLHNMGESPLQRLKRYYKTEPLNLNHNLRYEDRDLFIAEYRSKIYASKKELRRPEIKLKGLVYRGSELTDRRLAGTVVRVKRDKRDIRSIRVYKTNGQKIATLYAPRAYMHYPLSERTYERVKKFVDDYGASVENPVLAYLRHLFLNKGSKRIGLEFVQVSEEIQTEGFLQTPSKKQIKQIAAVERECKEVHVPCLDDLLDGYNFEVSNAKH